MRRETQERIAVEVPEGWLLDETERPPSLRRHAGDGGVVQFSRLQRRRDDVAPASAERAAGWVYRTAAQLTGGDVISDRPSRDSVVEIHPERLVQTETWQDGECVNAWLDCRGGDTPDERFGIGFREWPDAAVLLTWIGTTSELPFRPIARTIFESLQRLD